MSSAVDPAREFLEFWRNYFEQTAIQTRILFESMQGGKSFEHLHHQWLETLSAGLDGFMRTPAFLEVLKQSLKRMTDLKLAQDQMAQSVAQQAGLPMAGDLTGLFERVSSAEQTILKRLERVEERLRTIETALDSSPAERESEGEREGGRKGPTRKKDLAAGKRGTSA
ncbi:MAG: hypothetical protein U0790_15850 [Isosphaeraceae bacterium]